MSDIRPLSRSRFTLSPDGTNNLGNEETNHHHFMVDPAIGLDTTPPRAVCTTTVGHEHEGKTLPCNAHPIGTACDKSGCKTSKLSGNSFDLSDPTECPRVDGACTGTTPLVFVGNDTSPEDVSRE